MFEPIVIDFNKLAVYEAGALLLMLLAYPEKKISDQQRTDIHASLCNWALRVKGKEDQNWLVAPQIIKPLYALRDAEQIAIDLKTFARRLRDRTTAGRMAMAFLMESVTGNPPNLPQGIKKLSINEVAVMALKESGQSDPENVETRIWRTSLPVIHLCAAVQFFMKTLERSGKPVRDFTDILNNRLYIECIISTALDFEPLLASSKLKINPATLRRLRLSS